MSIEKSAADRKLSNVVENKSGARAVWSDLGGKFAIRCVQLIVVIAVVVGIVFASQKISTVMIPLILALILASTFYPIMRWLRNKGLPSIAATLIVLLSIIAVLGGVIWMIVQAVINQSDMLVEQARSGLNQVIDYVKGLPFDINHATIESWRTSATEFLTSSEFGTGALNYITAVGTGVTGFVLLIVILFFFLKDGPQIWAFLCRPFTGEAEARADRIGRKTVDCFGAYVRGTATVAFVDALGIGIGLLILQVPLALPLAVLVFVLSFIPIVGAITAGILAALVALVSNGFWSAVIVVLIVVVVNQLEGNLLQPMLMGRAMKLHSLVILLALAVGTVLSGILGAILAVPMVAVAWGIVQVWHGEDKPAYWARPKGLEPADINPTIKAHAAQ